ncbi:hypothetical protein J6590_022515 [Homalodisca vitripennis]|nr:hypothetical protein J6590_022515 [Homalodisca vitripennis]
MLKTNDSLGNGITFKVNVGGIGRNKEKRFKKRGNVVGGIPRPRSHSYESPAVTVRDLEFQVVTEYYRSNGRSEEKLADVFIHSYKYLEYKS